MKQQLFVSYNYNILIMDTQTNKITDSVSKSRVYNIFINLVCV